MPSPLCMYKPGREVYCTNRAAIRSGRHHKVDGKYICEEHLKKIEAGGPRQFHTGLRPDMGEGARIQVRRSGQQVRD